MGADDRVEFEAVFQVEFLEDLEYWIGNNRKISLRILKMVREVLRTPYEGIGQPEALKYEYSGCWSRRINQEHRLIYTVSDNRVQFLKARYHYK
ncbi:Addiction module toxin, Txe/YoeB [Calothrix sp. PCC 7716]|nr:Addiction module toxin, Txe/YoeB [Calothrix sp. PCC 7716]